MARNVAGFYPWDKENPNEKGIYSSKYKNVLNKERPTLTTVDIRPMFPHLQALGVIDNITKDRIEFNATPAQMNCNLCDHIERGPCSRLHGYLRACVLTNQDHIVTLLGFNPRDYRLPTDVPYNTQPVQPSAPSWGAGTQTAAPPLQHPVPVKPVREPQDGDINHHPGDVIDETQRDRMIKDLSLGLVNDWYRCGLLLGIEPPVLDNIESGESLSGPALKMLMKWRQQHGNLNQADLKFRLCQGLRNAKLDVHVSFVTNSQDTIDIIIAYLSGHLGTQWKDLASELGIHHSDIQAMTTPNVRSHKDCAEDMLIRWSRGAHGQNIVKLKKALWSVERIDLMTHIQQYIVRQ